MNKQESIEQARYLHELAERATQISVNFNTEVGRKFGKYRRGNTVYFVGKQRRIYYTVDDVYFDPIDEVFRYRLQPVRMSANMYSKIGVLESELLLYNYPID